MSTLAFTRLFYLAQQKLVVHDITYVNFAEQIYDLMPFQSKGKGIKYKSNNVRLQSKHSFSPLVYKSEICKTCKSSCNCKYKCVDVHTRTNLFAKRSFALVRVRRWPNIQRYQKFVYHFVRRFDHHQCGQCIRAKPWSIRALPWCITSGDRSP